MTSSNPVLSAAKFVESRAEAVDASDHMTVEGTIARTFLLLIVAIAAAIIPWQTFFAHFVPNSEQTLESIPNLSLFLFGGMIGGFILALIICFVPKMAPWLAVPYAAAEGLFLGAISATFELQFPGIVMQAAAGTFGVLMIMLALYAFGVIRATQKFRAIVLSATLGIALLYLVLLICGWLNIANGLTQELYGSGFIGIGFSVFVCVIAALNLIMDFDLIETGARERAPKFMSWFAAFGLLVTLVWLYLEMLRLIAKLRSRD